MNEVSYFSRVDDIIPKEYNLDEWLQMTLKPPDNLRKEVEMYRETMQEKYKKNLPCITISAIFNERRDTANIKKKNPFICIDIDRYSKSKKAKSNICIDFERVRELVKSHPCCYYAGLSCSEDGMYVIFKIEDSENLKGYFEYFRDSFSKIGINIDESCKDYTRLRFFSIDLNGYYNPDAKVFRLKKEIEPEPAKVQPMPKERAQEVYSNYEKARKVIDNCKNHSIDITSNYDDWVAVGAGFYNEFGEQGRELFHEISSIHSGYDFKECEKKFSSCKKMGKITIGTFFKIALDYGIKYKS